MTEEKAIIIGGGHLRIIGGYTSEANWRERACDRKRECRKQHL